MHVLRDYRDCPAELKGAALAIGNFDGVHRGHQAVIRAAMQAGREAGALAGTITFEPHPREFFQPDTPVFRLTPEPLKLELFAALGLDLAVVLPFDAALSALTAQAFVAEVLAGGLGARHVATGHDFQFGKGREGTPENLKQFGRQHGFATTVVQAVAGDAGIYSSSDVRDLLRKGDPHAAAESLGYWWRVRGRVTGGERRGHGLGFPTANVAVPPGFALKHGIYAVRVLTEDARVHGAAYLGTRPTFGAGEPLIEVFLFDFEGDLYGQDIEMEFIAWVRGDETFADAGALKDQMARDCEQARAALAAVEADDPVLRFPLGRALAARETA